MRARGACGTSSVSYTHLDVYKRQANPFSMPNGGLEILEKAERGEVDPLDIYAYQYDLVRCV